MAGLTASPLGPTEGFNWVYLVELLICGILSLFFLFYFNRLFATVISYGIRAYTWHKYRAYVDITALQISLLGGRIFFKSIRYHAHNITVLVHDGHITWRYWLRGVQEAEIFSGTTDLDRSAGRTASKKPVKDADEKLSPSSLDSDHVEAGPKQRKELPCRISIKVSGVEAFLYNRSPLYDGIVEATLKKAQASTQESSEEEQLNAFDKEYMRSSTDSSHSPAAATSPTEPPQWLHILPIRIQCKRAAAAVGNENTTSILTAKVEHTTGQIDAAAAQACDLYKLLFNFEFHQVLVAMKPNKDYKCTQSKTAQLALRRGNDDESNKQHVILSVFSSITRFLSVLTPKRKGMREKGSIRTASIATARVQSLPSRPEDIPGNSEWHGLTRYLTDDTSDEQAEWRGIEYAKASTLADCKQIDMRFYWDIPGAVGVDADEGASLLDTDGNASTAEISPPAYGLDLAVHGGFVTYGPWADRERVNLQRIFFPAPYVDAVPVNLPRAGETRLATVFKLFLAIEEDVTLRIPTREASKDPRWKGRANNTQNPPVRKSYEARNRKRSKTSKNNAASTNADSRPYGWLDVTVKPNSTVRYTMDMYARKIGFHNFIDLDIKGTEITSSVNHALLWRAGALTLCGNLSNPLEWNRLRDWPFKIICDDLELFILRDHMFLIIDLVDDWASGPPPDYYTFLPFKYNMDLTFNNFVMYLNTNDANIINDPADMDHNDFLTLEGNVLKGVLGIPMQSYRPQRNEITFDVDAQHMSMRMLASSRNTIRTLLQDKLVARLPHLTLLGSFESNQEQMRGLTDTLRMDIEGTGFSMQAYGFLLRHLINIKENYFGDYVHFKTLEEFQNAGDSIVEAHDRTASLPKPKAITELDVLLSIVVKDASIMLPTNLYSAKEFIRAEVPEALVDLRVTSYYLDLAINISPISIHLGMIDSAAESAKPSLSNTQIYVSHTAVYGHRAFGLPPNEATYASTWDIDVGAITGEMKKQFLHDAVLAAKALMFTFQDRENALPLDSPLLMFDTTFVQVRTAAVRLWLHIEEEAILLSLDPVTVHSNDWADETFSQRVNVLAPNITLACVDCQAMSRHHGSRDAPPRARTYAFLQTSLSLDMVARKQSFAAEAHKQQAYIRLNDLRTNRVPFLKHSGAFWDNVELDDQLLTQVDAPAMVYPSYPGPVCRDQQTPSRAPSTGSFEQPEMLSSIDHQSPSSSLASSIRGARFLTLQQTDKRASSRATQRTVVSQMSSQDEGLTDTSSINKPGRSQNSMTFSSAYAAPLFPLDTFKLDLSAVPSFGAEEAESSTSSATSAKPLDEDDPMVEDDTSQVNIIVRLIPGIRMYIEPKIGDVAAHLMETIQAKTVDDIIDAFQTDVMSDVLERQAEQKQSANVTQLCIKLPSLTARVLNRTENNAQMDFIDMRLTSLRLMTRIRGKSEKYETGSLSLHTTLTGLELALRSELSDSGEDVAVRVLLNDLTLWLAMARANNVRVVMTDTSVEVMAPAAMYLSQLTHRLLPLVTRLQDKFLTIQSHTERRLQLLLYQLTQLGEHVGDPAFLTKMTYILRAFPNHFRNQESWKVLMRFRNILNSLPATMSTHLAQIFHSRDVACPEDAPQKMLESWTQWRNWDVINIGQTAAFSRILGQAHFHDLQEPTTSPLCLTWSQESIRIALKDLHVESYFVVSDLSFGVDVEPPRMPTGLMLVEENKRIKTLAHLHATMVAFELQWHLIDIVDELLPQFLADIPLSMSDTTKRSTTQTLEDGIYRQEVHLVLSTDAAQLSLHTMNLHHVAEAQGLRMSLIGTTQANEPYGICAGVIINADRTGTQLYAHKSMMWESLLLLPSIYVDYLRPRAGADMAPAVNIAVAYKEVELKVVEQIPGILRTVDTIFADEVVQILRVIRTVDEHQASTTASPQALQQIPSGSDMSIKVQGALLAGELIVEVSLLQSLRYRLVGTAASMRVAPSLVEAALMTIDFATGKLLHSFVNVSHGEEHEQNIVDVPPVNGHVVLRTMDSAQKVSVLTTIGRLEIEAEVLQAVATTLNRKEVQNVITSIKDGIEDIQERANRVLPKQEAWKARKEMNSGPAFMYDVRLALAGVRVAASTPHGTSRATAGFELGIGACNAIASNERTITLGDSPLFPEVRATLRDIGAKLVIKHVGKHRERVFPGGNVTLALAVNLSVHEKDGKVVRELAVRSQQFDVNVYPETAAITVDVINQLQDRLKHLDLSQEMNYIKSLRHRRTSHHSVETSSRSEVPTTPVLSAAELLSIKLRVELKTVVMSWLVHDNRNEDPVEDLVLTLAAIELSTNGVQEGKLTIRDLQLQLVPRGEDKQVRTLNSALLPEIIFTLAYWSENKNRNLAFKATGKPLDLRLDSRFVVPFTGVKRSIDYAVDKFRAGTANWQTVPTTSGLPRESLLGGNHFASLTAEADFAGAQVYLQGSKSDSKDLNTMVAAAQTRGAQHGRYGQFAPDDGIINTTLRSPGISFKLQYDNQESSSVQAEMMVASSSNMLLPNVVPLILEVSKSIKEIMQAENTSDPMEQSVDSTKLPQPTMLDEAFITADPTAILGKTKLNLGLRVARQEFGLTCQPIAKIDAKAELDDFYFTVNTIDSPELGHFFAISASMSKLSAKVKHVYSREPTFSFEIDSIVLSLMNNKHFSGVNGISAILKINPSRTSINGKQLQDLLLFREIWLPPEIRSSTASSPQADQYPDILIQRYQTVASAASFPWNATVAFSELGVDLDLGQSIGKTSFKITNLWASSQKTSNLEQNLCVGLDEVSMNSQGRMSGFIYMDRLAVRTLIQWPEQDAQFSTPRIQASIGFGRMRAKAAFDYQAFAFGDIEGLDFLMYNVRDNRGHSDRLVAILDCSKAYVFCTSTSAAQAFGLYQAVDRLIQEKQAAFSQSLKEIEKYVRRESTITPTRFGPRVSVASPAAKSPEDFAPITLHTDVVLSLGNICVGAFPGTFFDSQLFKVEASNLQARFAVGLESGKIRGGLGMTIGQLQVALAAVKKIPVPKNISDLGVDEVIAGSVESRGGVILKVPRVIASMETWQTPKSTQIEYIFKSLFEGKVDIGWNLSRINLIRGMWTTHSRALASRMGKPLPTSAVKITADLQEKSESKNGSASSLQQNKITAEVNLPQSRYQYVALEPPTIETPQLRDMGEATPPLEWIGLHRDRLPNITHQIIIVALLEIAKEVEDAYGRILGTS